MIILFGLIVFRVRVWDESGGSQGEWSAKGSAFGQLERPSGICIDSRGRVLVADQGNQRYGKLKYSISIFRLCKCYAVMIRSPF